MDTFLTILLWLGSGFAFAIGVAVGVALVKFGSKERNIASNQGQESIRLMAERNRLDERKVNALEELAEWFTKPRWDEDPTG